MERGFSEYVERSLRVINGKRFQCNQWKEAYV